VDELSESVDEPGTVTFVGFRAVAKPAAGDTVSLRLTVPEKPSRLVTVIVAATEELGDMAIMEARVERPKSGGGTAGILDI